MNRDTIITVGTHGPCVPHKNRKSPRASFHNYSGGIYFITICTSEKRHYFGHISDDEMHLSKIGEYCSKQFYDLSTHYKYAHVNSFVVMPNHVHALITIDDNIRTHAPCVPTERTCLSVIVGGLKRAVTIFAKRNGIEFGWQGRYHDHIIRVFEDYRKILEYIETNIIRWSNDCFYR